MSHLTDARWWGRRFKVTPTEMMSVAHKAISDYCYEKGIPLDNELANQEAASATRWVLS